jgi:hypothetical protein
MISRVTLCTPETILNIICDITYHIICNVMISFICMMSYVKSHMISYVISNPKLLAMREGYTVDFMLVIDTDETAKVWKAERDAANALLDKARQGVRAAWTEYADTFKQYSSNFHTVEEEQERALKRQQV